jgi:hypothetical protein
MIGPYGLPADADAGTRVRGVEWLTLAVLAVWAAPLALVVAVVPYHHWDELAYGEWSRLIAASGEFRFPSITPLTYQRPLLYVAQGWLWRLLGEHEVLGRLLALGFLVMLIVAVYRLGGVTGGPETRRQLGALAVLVLLSVTEVALAAGATLTDLPVAALVATTAALLWTSAAGWASNLGLTIVAAAAVLVKPTALPALAGLAAAHALGPWRDCGARLRRLGWLGLGAMGGLAYSVWMAKTLHQSLQEFLQGAILRGYYADLSHRVRVSQVVNVEWLGPWLCLPLLASLLYVAARVTDRAARLTDMLPIAVAALWGAAWFAPAGGATASLGTAVSKGWITVILFAAVMAASGAAGEAASRLFVLRQIVWAAPAFVSWMIYAPYEMRLLAPIWAPLVLLTAVPIARGLAGWFRLTPLVGGLLLVAVAVLAASNARMIHGIDVRTSVAIAKVAIESGGDAARIRRILSPDVEPVLEALRPRLRPNDRIFSPEGRLRYYFPGRVAQAYPTRCEDLVGYRFFVLPLIPAVRDYFIHIGVSPEPGFWSACRRPRLDRIPAEGTAVIFEITGGA